MYDDTARRDQVADVAVSRAQTSPRRRRRPLGAAISTSLTTSRGDDRLGPSAIVGRIIRGLGHGSQGGLTPIPAPCRQGVGEVLIKR